MKEYVTNLASVVHWQTAIFKHNGWLLTLVVFICRYRYMQVIYIYPQVALIRGLSDNTVSSEWLLWNNGSWLFSFFNLNPSFHIINCQMFQLQCCSQDKCLVEITQSWYGLCYLHCTILLTTHTKRNNFVVKLANQILFLHTVANYHWFTTCVLLQQLSLGLNACQLQINVNHAKFRGGNFPLP